MTLGFKTKFADGEPTLFEEKILAGVNRFVPNYALDPKIHSLREDPNNRWKAGKNIQMATGVRTKNYRQFNKDIPELATCKSTQRIFMTYDWCLEITVGGRELDTAEIAQLIKNDGVSYDQFINWFFPKDIDEWSGKIIHWTDFKY